MQKNPCSGLDVNPLHPSMTLQDYQDAVSLEDGLYPIEGNSADYTYIDADAIGYKTTSVGDALKYSTTEHIVGEWIDGKPVYEITVNTGAMPNASTATIPTGLTNVDLYIDMRGFAYKAGYTIPLPHVNTNVSNNVLLTVDRTTNSILIRTAANISDYANSYVTLRYTKTS